MISAATISFAIPATLAAGAIRTAVGFGAGVFLTASLSLFFDAKLTLAVMAFLQLPLGASAGYHFWGRWERRLVWPMVPALLVGVVLGGYLLTVLDTLWVRKIMGVTLAGYGAAGLLRSVAGEPPARPMRVPEAGITGFVSGLAGALTSVSGVILAIYVRTLKLPHDVFVGTLTAVQFFHDIFRVAAYWRFGLLDLDAVTFSLACTPFIFLGGWVGALIGRAASPKVLARVILLFVLLSGIRLLF